MTFIEAAVVLLREHGGPISVDQLCRMALDRKMLSRPGKDPLRSMKGRLTTEWKKGEASRVVRVGNGIWQARLEPGMDELLAPKQRIVRSGTNMDQCDADIVSLYSDDSANLQPLSAYQEYSDGQTQDEDRPLRPEIVATRRERWERSRNGRTSRGRRHRNEDRKQVSTEELPPSERDQSKALRSVADSVADIVEQQMLRMHNRRAVSVRQLVHMVRGRLVEGESKEVTAHTLKVMLLHDTRDRVAQGKRPRFYGTGREQFGLTSTKIPNSVLSAESAVEDATQTLQQETFAALQQHLGGLKASAMEHLAQRYLAHNGWKNVAWIKRSEHASYALGTWDYGEKLIGIRIGKSPVDRAGVGELRVGIKVKKLPGGLLLASAELGAEAKEELNKADNNIDAICGQRFLQELARAQLGIVSAVMPISYLDTDFLEQLSAI